MAVNFRLRSQILCTHLRVKVAHSWQRKPGILALATTEIDIGNTTVFSGVTLSHFPSLVANFVNQLWWKLSQSTIVFLQESSPSNTASQPRRLLFSCACNNLWHAFCGSIRVFGISSVRRVWAPVCSEKWFTFREIMYVLYNLQQMYGSLAS